jgi:signal transduction histidine kinase
MICYLYPEPSFLFFISDVPDLLYYSHLPVAILSLFVGLLIFLSGRKLLLNQLMLYISLCFSLWIFFNLIAWTNIHSDYLLFIWPLFGILSAFISILSIYFAKVFINGGKDISVKQKLVFLSVLAPLLIFAPTDLNLSGFNLTNCDAFGFEGILFKFYYIAIGLLGIIWVPVILLRGYRKAALNLRRQIVLIGVGLESFLFFFFTITFLASYLAGIRFFQDSRLEFYGLFGMAIFMVFISILMTKFKTFNVGLISSQALVGALLVLISSEYTFVTSVTSKSLVTLTLLLTAVTGYFLIRSVRKEISQRQQIQGLVSDLEKANTRLKQLDRQKSEFVSIASHQLRSPLTSIAGYASLLREGNYGNIPQKMLEPLDRIEQSARFMAEAVEDFLNVSRIESGNMKYNLTDFNLRDEAEHIADDIRPEALRQGLVLLFRTSMQGKGVVHADLGKVQQILHNLINNALKYTPKGTINVVVRDDIKNKRIYVDIVDTGIGMNTETLHSIFQKFERGDKANSVNVKGTGLGLYVALRMAEAMGGTVVAHSEGEGKGSRFTVELPLVM